MQYKFPKGFWWGGAISGMQTEGANFKDGKAANVYDHFFKVAPQRFFGGIGPDKTSNYYYDYKEYHRLCKEIGMQSLRTSIQWARFMPEGKLNPKGVDFYHRIIDDMLENSIEPFITLFHFDMPMFYQNMGGFENKAVVDAYTKYAEAVFKEYGDKISKFFTFNEPVVPVLRGYLYDLSYPNIVNFKKAVQVAYHITLASSKAIEIFRAYQRQDSTIGMVINLSPVYPRDENNAEDVKSAKLMDQLLNDCFLSPAVLGFYKEELVDFLEQNNLMPTCQKEDASIIKNNTIDLLGFNYYHPKRVKAKETKIDSNAPIMPENFYDDYDMPGKKMNPYRGWEIYEKGIYDTLIRIKNDYGNIPTYISENGMGVENEERFRLNGQIQDTYRIDFIKDHLSYCHKAIEEGCNLKGYHIWSPFDNWSFINAYKNTYGLIEVDINNNFKKTFKLSAKWYADLIKNNGF
jgi:6-phospho-beta-glucosidase